MGCAAKVIVLDDVRASQQRQALRQQLHAHFDRWLDEIEAEGCVPIFPIRLPAKQGVK